MSGYRQHLAKRIALLSARDVARLCAIETHPASLLQNKKMLDFTRSDFQRFVTSDRSSGQDFTGIEEAWRAYLEWSEREHPKQIDKAVATARDFHASLEEERAHAERIIEVLMPIAKAIRADNNRPADFRSRGADLLLQEMSARGISTIGLLEARLKPAVKKIKAWPAEEILNVAISRTSD